MFKKNTADASAGPERAAAASAGPARKGAPRPPSVVAADLAVHGDLSSDGELMVDGLVCGEVSVRRLVVGLEGRIIGNVAAETVDIYGEIRGNVTAAAIRLYKNARAVGDLTQSELLIEVGAVFEGRCIPTDAATCSFPPQGAGAPPRTALSAPAAEKTPEPEPA